ncbi:MAG TPA: PQQ-binding-like beta-propeller repeat protein [Xanthobacteraceae bacterium]|nr:PQQ-binding-like beta-propeller repeat protein [Xanthobacteraceae bacterium]
MSQKTLVTALASIGVAAFATTAMAADVTSERLLNSANDPQNWLMVHRDYNNSRHSPLKDVNKTNVKDLKPKFIFSIGGRSTGGTLRGKEEATPLVDDGFLYVPDTWSRVMKFDVRNGTAGIPLWRHDPKLTQSRTTRGLAMYGNKVFASTNDMRLIALDRDSGAVAWEVSALAPTDPVTGTPSPKTQSITGAPLTLKTKGGKELIVQGESSGGQLGTRSWVAAWDVSNGNLAWRTFTIPAPGEPGSETWKDNHNAWRVGGGGVWQTGSYDPATNLIYFGTGDAFPSFDPEFRPGDNLFTASTIALDADTGKIVWYFQETPNEHWDFDTPSPKMLYDTTINGESRKVVANFSRNGYYYTLDRNSGQFLRADQYQEKITWTKGIDQKTGKPVDYDPTKNVQVYNGVGVRRGKPGQEACPWWNGSPTFFPPTMDSKRMIAYVAGAEGCISGTTSRTALDENKNYVGLPPCCSEHGRVTAHGALWAMDVKTGKIIGKETFQPPTESGMLSTDGDLLFTGHMNGKFAAYDKDTLKEVWSFNLGTMITAPPMTYSVGGKQYVAVVAGGGVGTRGAGLMQPSAFVAVFGF